MLGGRQRERGFKTKMKVKLAAKMLKIAWTLVKKQQVFDPDYLSPFLRGAFAGPIQAYVSSVFLVDL
jgi:hypothetical protein